ncbi:MAG TPA: hypothetical protein VN721_15455 [Flavipsychrobacter sp.]|nr:hypothetical protein [Flavipsychrobacter sp.]
MYRALLLMLVLFLSSFDNFSSTNGMVMRTAQQELPRFMALIPADHANLYGFSTDDNLQTCTVGKPFQMLALNADFYNGNYVAGKTYIVPGKVWRVPVISNGAYRTLLTVAGDNGNYNAVDIGGAGLATELQQKSAGASKDDNYYLLRVYPLSADFFVDAKTSSLADASFIPLSSAYMAIPSLQNKSYSMDEILAVIKSTLNQTKN